MGVIWILLATTASPHHQNPLTLLDHEDAYRISLQEKARIPEVSGDWKHWIPTPAYRIRTIRERSEVVGVLGLSAARVATLLQVSLKGR